MIVISPALSLGQVVHEVVESLSVLPVEERLKISLLKKFDVVWERISGKKGGFKTKDEEMEYKERGVLMIKRVENHPGPILKKAVKISSEINLPNYFLSEEDRDSLQLPIYLLLASNTQKRKIEKASYWYLDKNDDLTPKELPRLTDSFEKIYEVARRIKLARQTNHFVCPHGGCIKCRPLEKVFRGEGEKVGVSDTRQDIYVLN